MFWVELFTGPKNEKGEQTERVAHCAYYWDAVQRVEMKSQLILLNQKLEKILGGSDAAAK